MWPAGTVLGLSPSSDPPCVKGLCVQPPYPAGLDVTVLHRRMQTINRVPTGLPCTPPVGATARFRQKRWCREYVVPGTHFPHTTFWAIGFGLLERCRGYTIYRCVVHLLVSFTAEATRALAEGPLPTPKARFGPAMRKKSSGGRDGRPSTKVRSEAIDTEEHETPSVDSKEGIKTNRNYKTQNKPRSTRRVHLKRRAK